MIVLDTHIWVWWVARPDRLQAKYSSSQIQLRIPQTELQPLPYGRGSTCSLVQSRDHQGAVAAEYVGELMKWSTKHRDLLERGVDRVFGVSIISCWEVAKLVEYGRLKLDRHVGPWIESALAVAGVSLLPLNPQIVVESTQLPQPFHRDPADRLLVATARVLHCPIMTEDSKIAAYPHVRIA